MTVRDPRTGRFVATTSNTPESRQGKFSTYAEMPLEIQGADPADLAYDTVPRRGPDADELAQGGARSPLRTRNPTLVHPDDAVHATWGVQGAILRTAARRAGPMDPSPYLVGLENQGGPSTGVKEITNGD